MYKHPDNTKPDEPDHTLDAALAKYAAVEPRAGLEDRVLANLRAERSRVPDSAWWRWGVAGALAAVVVVALALAWRSSGRPAHPVVENRPSPTPQTTATTARVSLNGEEKQMRGKPAGPQKLVPVRRTTVHRAQAEPVASANPKLDQFPSPRPLSEQEKILASYIEQYPERAILLARARTEQLRHDQLEEMRAGSSGDLPSDSDERNHDTTQR
jgi:hypothetical protein